MKQWSEMNMLVLMSFAPENISKVVCFMSKPVLIWQLDN